MIEPKKIFESGDFEVSLYFTPGKDSRYPIKHLLFQIGEVSFTLSGNEVWRLADTLDQYGIHP